MSMIMFPFKLQINISDDLCERRSTASTQNSDVESLNDIAGTSSIVNAIEPDDDVDSHLSLWSDFTSVTALSSFTEDLFDIDCFSDMSDVSISTEYQQLFDLLSIDEKADAFDASKDTKGSYITTVDIAHIIVRGQLVSRGHFVNTIIFQRIFIF